MLVNNTPVEPYQVSGHTILVKREDLCCPYPGPSFSKMRGVVAHIAGRSEKYIGVLDTYHSKAGWAVAWACKHMNKQCVNFWPRYTGDKPSMVWPPRQQQREAVALGAIAHETPAGRSSILYYRVRKILRESSPNSYMMPNALKLPESVTENAAEARRTVESGAMPDHGTVVISISSGTVAAGVLKGLASVVDFDRYHIVLHMGYSRSVNMARKYMESVSGVTLGYNVDFIDEGYAYKDRAKNVEVPFPCNDHYDLKAWKWLMANRSAMSGPVVFWNIGD